MSRKPRKQTVKETAVVTEKEELVETETVTAAEASAEETAAVTAEAAAEETSSEPEQVEETTTPESTITPPPTEPAVQEAPVKVDLPPALKLVQQRLESYAQAMNPGLPMAPGECAQHQLSLYRLLMSVVGMQGQQFQLAMGIVVAAIREHRKGVFAERYIARDFENLPLSTTARLFFERMIRLLLVTADVKQRDQVSRHVDVPAVIKYLPDTKAQQRILEYYNVG